MTISAMELDAEPNAGIGDRLFVHRDEKGRSFSTSTPFVHGSDYAKGLRSVPGSILLADCDDSGLGASITESCVTSFADCSRATDASESMCTTPTFKLDLPRSPDTHTQDLSRSPLSRWSYLCRRSLDSSLSEDHDDTIDVINGSLNSSRSSCARRLNLDLDLNASSDSDDECCINDTGFDQSCIQPEYLVHTPLHSPVPSSGFSSLKTIFNDESLLVDKFNDILQKFSPPEADRLIGRKMGEEKVDIIGELDQRNIICLSVILSYLDPEDLCRMCCVNQQWRNVCNGDAMARKRRKKYIREKQSYLEEIGKENTDQKPSEVQVRTVSGTSVLRALATVQLVNETQLYPGPQEKKPRTTTDIFSKAASNLKNEESLRKCPKCLKPAKILPMQDRGHCQNSDCDYEYCTKCMHAFHGSKDCSPILAKRTKTDSVGSKKSKKNLKRL